MANYETGLDSRKKIIDICKILFYEKGFDETTFKEIGVQADINQGLIVYYFKNKNMLGNTIFQQFISEMMQRIDEQFPQEDFLTRYFISDFLYFRLIYEDPAFRKFIFTCCSNGALNKNQEIFEPDYAEYYSQIINFFNDGYIVDETLQEGLISVYEGTKGTYSIYICQNYEKMTVDVAATNYITIYCHLLDIPKSVYGTKMLAAELLANKVAISGKQFDFTMKKTV